MAELMINLPDGQQLAVLVEDGAQLVPIDVAECACGCGKWFQSTDKTKIYFDDQHRIDHNNAKRIPKTSRKKK